MQGLPQVLSRPREEYFETLKALGDGLTMTDEERGAFYLRHDNFWV
jgi:hypothetical protein